MRIRNQCVFGTVALLSQTMLAFGQPSQYCQAFMDQMATDSLYVATCGGRTGCLEKVVDGGGGAVLQGDDGKIHPLQKAQRYNFIFKTPPDGMPNSLVVVQVKQLDATPRSSAEASPVRLRRYGLDFACYRGRQDASLPQWPAAGTRGRDLTSIPYKSYDEFHRDGFTSQDHDAILRTSFHVRYFNGQTCVSTLDPIRRAQFLMHDSQHYSGRVGTFFANLGLYSTPANAQEFDTVKNYERLKVVVSNYRRGNNAPGCFAFSTKAGRPESSRLDIVIRDIERQVQAYPADPTKSWSFVLQ